MASISYLLYNKTHTVNVFSPINPITYDFKIKYMGDICHQCVDDYCDYDLQDPFYCEEKYCKCDKSMKISYAFMMVSVSDLNGNPFEKTYTIHFSTATVNHDDFIESLNSIDEMPNIQVFTIQKTMDQYDDVTRKTIKNIYDELKKFGITYYRGTTCGGPKKNEEFSKCYETIIGEILGPVQKVDVKENPHIGPKKKAKK